MQNIFGMRYIKNVFQIFILIKYHLIGSYDLSNSIE